MGVQYLRANLADHFIEPPVEVADDRKLANPRQPGGEPGRHPGPQKLPFTDALARRSRRVMLAARQQYRLPAQRPLLVYNAEGAIDIAALERQRMVEDVKYPHQGTECAAILAEPQVGITIMADLATANAPSRLDGLASRVGVVGALRDAEHRRAFGEHLAQSHFAGVGKFL
jgi:hypothetical protein